jgi:hypothetical protein
MDDLRALKIWMDGQGPPSGSIHPALRLEDKWVQYHLLSPRLPLIPSRLVGQDSFVQMKARLAQGLKLVIKRRMTRGGRGLRIIDRPEQLAIAESTTPEYIWQPFVASRLRSHAFSLRAAAFAGRFICMFASLAPGDTSNHGIRFFIVPGERLGLRKTDYPTRKVVGPAWEADIFYRGQVPEYLRRDVFEEHIAETELSLPEGVIRKVRSYSARVSRLYSELEFENLPRSYIEETGFSQDRNDGA